MPSDPPCAKHGEGDHAQHGGGVSPVRQARALRRTMSLPEVLLWQRLRRRALAVKFRRQHPVDPYTLDFYCPAYRVAVEIDGEAHNRGDRPARDDRRDAFLAEKGLRVIRVAASRVMVAPDETAEAIVMLVAAPLHHRAARGGPPPHASHGEDQINAPGIR